jgi:DNA-binding transcriptional LysR family regulator
MNRMQPANARTPSHATGVPRSQRLRLDLLHTFEAAARRLSFTAAGEELFLSQSAVSRQIQQLEDNLGVPLFERRYRALALTDAGRVLQRAVDDSLERLLDAAARIRPAADAGHLAITCTPGFASLWLIPRLASFTSAHPQVDVRVSATLDVVDLEQRRIDVAVRLIPASRAQGPLLFAEEVLPLCAPRLLNDKRRPLRTPADLRHHTLLTVDMPHMNTPTIDWEPWMQLMKIESLAPASTLRFTQYSEAVAAAVAGQGVVIGRLPLLADLVREGKLVAPFRGRAASRRGYYVQLAEHAARNLHAHAFADWLQAQAAAAREAR